MCYGPGMPASLLSRPIPQGFTHYTPNIQEGIQVSVCAGIKSLNSSGRSESMRVRRHDRRVQAKNRSSHNRCPKEVSSVDSPALPTPSGDVDCLRPIESKQIPRQEAPPYLLVGRCKERYPQLPRFIEYRSRKPLTTVLPMMISLSDEPY